MIILDTDVLIEIERGNDRIISKMNSLKRLHREVGLTSAVYAEAMYGYLSIGKQERGREFLGAFKIIGFDKESAKIFAGLKHDLDKKGQPVPVFDLITASCVIRNGATLVSGDRHFAHIPGLNLISL